MARIKLLLRNYLRLFHVLQVSTWLKSRLLVSDDAARHVIVLIWKRQVNSYLTVSIYIASLGWSLATRCWSLPKDQTREKCKETRDGNQTATSHLNLSTPPRGRQKLFGSISDSTLLAESVWKGFWFFLVKRFTRIPMYGYIKIFVLKKAHNIIMILVLNSIYLLIIWDSECV